VLILLLIVGILAVARLSMLIVDDQILLPFRQLVVRKWGEDSWVAYLVHCNWCMSMWLATPLMPVAVLTVTGFTVQGIVLALLSIPTASLAAGLISKVRG
jgi:hypothetical protein